MIFEGGRSPGSSSELMIWRISHFQGSNHKPALVISVECMSCIDWHCIIYTCRGTDICNTTDKLHMRVQVVLGVSGMQGQGQDQVGHLRVSTECPT